MAKLIGPFTQIVTLKDAPNRGPLNDGQLDIITDAAVILDEGKIVEVGFFKAYNPSDFSHYRIDKPTVLVPGLVDCHTHLIWGGSRAGDYALRSAGHTYQEILAAGGGIFDSVEKTQKASDQLLLNDLLFRINQHLQAGITTIEVKTGYGLLPEQEIRLLKIIREAKAMSSADLVATCLAAHVCPKGLTAEQFLAMLTAELLPEIFVKGLARRVDIFVEDHAFPMVLAEKYLRSAKKLGFDLTVHADQFTTGGSELAITLGAQSADHLEVSGPKELAALAKSDVTPVVLPGASLGLGLPFAPARKLLNAGTGLAISTDWNPGSAPMGDLWTQAALLGVYEKLSAAELFAGITFRAAAALGLQDRGRIKVGKKADFVGFSISDFREIFYNQGSLKPTMVWKNGTLLK
jgi:imidazolonepropionase